MKITKRIIIRIIVAVAVAVILSKLKLIGIMRVSALTANTTFSYENVLISQKQIEFNFTTPFATNMKRGTLKTNVTINNNIVPSTGNIPTTLRQAIVYNGTSSNVCSIGSVNTGSIFSESNQSSTNRIDIRSTTYSLECEVTPNPKIEKIILYFSGTMNYAYLSFGPNVSFRENDILLQNETCNPGKNLFDNSSLNNKWLNASGVLFDSTGSNVIRYNNIVSGDSYTLKATYNTSNAGNIIVMAFFDSNDNLISRVANNSSLVITQIVPNNASYMLAGHYYSNPNTIQLEKGSTPSSYEPYGEVCKNKQDILLDEQKEQTKQQKETNDLIKSDDTTESNAKGKDFFDNFTSDSHGLSGVITSPIRLLNSFTTSTCSPLEFDLPFNMGHVSLPCMRGIYEQHFGIFFSLWQLITTGLISYNVCLNFYSKIRAMQNPYNDRIEVLNL